MVFSQYFCSFTEEINAHRTKDIRRRVKAINSNEQKQALMPLYTFNHKHPSQGAQTPISNQGKGRFNLLILSILSEIIGFVSLFSSCSRKANTFSPEERKATDSLVKSVHSAYSLALLQKRFEHEDNKLASIVALRELGKVLRNESRFEEALNSHSEGLQQAQALGDTIEWVQALNNVATDYRRMGVLDVAQEYHYQAKTLSEECSDTSFTAKKNCVVSYNELGNIYMSLGNYERADSALRMALAGEIELKSALGQAINYANIGSIFEHQKQIDSAWVYYRRSMSLNQEAGSDLGISLCHTYYGSLYEKVGQYDKAAEEYETAYYLMRASKDE